MREEQWRHMNIVDAKRKCFRDELMGYYSNEWMNVRDDRFFLNHKSKQRLFSDRTLRRLIRLEGKKNEVFSGKRRSMIDRPASKKCNAFFSASVGGCSIGSGKVISNECVSSSSDVLALCIQPG